MYAVLDTQAKIVLLTTKSASKAVETVKGLNSNRKLEGKSEKYDFSILMRGMKTGAPY